LYKKNNIKVIVVDDSLVFREIVGKGIAKHPRIEVVATAGDPYQASEKIMQMEPDVMLLDVEMPRMNGIEFLRRLMPQYPIPVIVVSAVNGMVFDALNAGAVDFVAKPDFKFLKSVEEFIDDIIEKVIIASAAKVGQPVKRTYNKLYKSPGTSLNSSIIAIGASTGGTEAIYSILSELPKDMPGILIVQHMPPVFTRLYAERLNNSCKLEVKEARSLDKVLPGKVFIAPGDSHMRVKKIANEYIVECYPGEKVNGHRPSVDILFESVAEHYGKNAIGVILTGMGYDGAKGLLSMKNKGARTIGQDKQSSIVYGMPKVAFDIGAVEQQVPLNGISEKICRMI
jgi:two-component system chemotaxis response regulator CheB